MTLTPDDFHPFQMAYDLRTQEFRIFGVRRIKGRTIPSSTKAILKKRGDLTTARQTILGIVGSKLSAQSVEDGYVPTRLVLNLDAHATQAGLVIEGHYEFTDGSRSGTHLKQYRLDPLSEGEIMERDHPQKPEDVEEFYTPANLASAERNSYKGLVTALRAIARAEEGF